MVTPIAVSVKLIGTHYMSKDAGLKTSRDANGAFPSPMRLLAALSMHLPFIEGKRLNNILSGGMGINISKSVSLFFIFNMILIINSGKFIVNNYRQALAILRDMPVALEQAKAALGITSDETFHRWHSEEKSYLTSLKKEPEGDILRAQYVVTLKKLREAE